MLVFFGWPKGSQVSVVGLVGKDFGIGNAWLPALQKAHGKAQGGRDSLPERMKRPEREIGFKTKRKATPLLEKNLQNTKDKKP